MSQHRSQKHPRQEPQSDPQPKRPKGEGDAAFYDRLRDAVDRVWQDVAAEAEAEARAAAPPTPTSTAASDETGAHDQGDAQDA